MASAEALTTTTGLGLTHVRDTDYPELGLTLRTDRKGSESELATRLACFIRASILRKLKLMSESGGLISPWLHHGEPDDFQGYSYFPMIRMQPGVRRGGLAFDVEALIRQVRKEAKQHVRRE